MDEHYTAEMNKMLNAGYDVATCFRNSKTTMTAGFRREADSGMCARAATLTNRVIFSVPAALFRERASW